MRRNKIQYILPNYFVQDCRETPAEIPNKLEREIQNIATWLSINKLTINEEKTEYMLMAQQNV